VISFAFSPSRLRGPRTQLPLAAWHVSRNNNKTGSFFLPKPASITSDNKFLLFCICVILHTKLRKWNKQFCIIYPGLPSYAAVDDTRIQNSSQQDFSLSSGTGRTWSTNRYISFLGEDSTLISHAWYAEHTI